MLPLTLPGPAYKALPSSYASSLSALLLRYTESNISCLLAIPAKQNKQRKGWGGGRDLPVKAGPSRTPPRQLPPPPAPQARTIDKILLLRFRNKHT